MSNYFKLGCVVTVNPLQTYRYIEHGFTIPGYSLPPDFYRDELEAVGDVEVGPFTDPTTDQAWWVDPSRPELANFGGWWVDTMLIEREVTRAWRVVQGDRPYARPGRLLDTGYIVTLEGTLHGATCCAVTAGWAAIQSMMTRECDPCVGSTFEFPAMLLSNATAGCDPDYPLANESALNPAGSWRTLFGIALSEAPTVVESTGTKCSTCGCGPFTRVRMVLRAQPGKFTAPTNLGSFLVIPPGAVVEAFTAPTPCVEDIVSDPLAPAPGPPDRAPVVDSSSGVPQVNVARSKIVLDASNSLLFPTVGIVSISAGDEELRNLRLRWWREMPGAPDIAYEECTAFGGLYIPYLPEFHTLNIDGRTGTALVQRENGDTVDGRHLVRGATSGPWSGSFEFPPGRWVVRTEADPTYTGSTAFLSISTVIVEP